jgi:hypothetical protein
MKSAAFGTPAPVSPGSRAIHGDAEPVSSIMASAHGRFGAGAADDDHVLA